MKKDFFGLTGHRYDSLIIFFSTEIINYHPNVRRKAPVADFLNNRSLLKEMKWLKPLTTSFRLRNKVLTY